MKKILMVGVPILALLFTSGCGNTKELSCTMSDNANGMEMSQDVKVTFKKDTAKKLDMSMKITLDDELKDYASEMEKEMKSEYASMEDAKGVTIKTSTKDNVVSLNVVADLDKMDDEAKEELDLAGKTETYDELKKSLEDQGYTCK